MEWVVASADVKLHILIVIAQKVSAKSKDEAEDNVGECRKLCEEIIVDSSNKPPVKEVKIFDRLTNRKLKNTQQKRKSSTKDDCVTTEDKNYHLVCKVESDFFLHFLAQDAC